VFVSTHKFLLFDYLRVPYAVASANGSSFGCIESGGNSPAVLIWVAHAASGGRARPGGYRVGEIPIHGHVLHEAAGGVPPRTGRRWTRWLPVTDARGAHVASVWRADDGSAFLPFEPDELISNCWSEAYLGLKSGRLRAGAGRAARRAYYRVRPVLSRKSQIRMRRAFSRIQGRTAFPRWPIEPSLHDLYELLLGIAADVAGEPVPMLAAWPAGYSWALVLTHDVETRVGYESISLLREIELRSGCRSSWYFVPERDYQVEETLLRSLSAEGFEVGLHGLRHDGRDLDSLETLTKRLPRMREYARSWNAAGFRAPSSHRVWEWMPLLGFDYDSSYADTAPYEPQPGGCCTWLPYQNRDLVELPITLPQDHAVFEILSEFGEQLWFQKTEFLREQGGMSLLLTHPDYMLDERTLGAYERFLDTFAPDPTAWKPLPREASAWWRRRAASWPEREGSEWRVAGPAAGEGAVALVNPS
jgi:peptidoglycan/xylan/chitin deacetylase (PgdA/CDA1 family)